MKPRLALTPTVIEDIGFMLENGEHPAMIVARLGVPGADLDAVARNLDRRGFHNMARQFNYAATDDRRRILALVGAPDRATRYTGRYDQRTTYRKDTPA